VFFANFFKSLPKRTLVAGLLFVLLLAPAAFSLDTQDSQVFIAGFNAYQKKEYPAAIDKMSQVLQKYPDTPLRDMALFWLARANFKAGNQKEAARTMAQFFKEYPESPLKGTVEEELATLVGKYQRGERIEDRQPAAAQVAAKAESDPQAAEATAKAREEAERLTAQKMEQERLAAEKVKAEQEHLAAEKAKVDQERLAREKAETQRLAAEAAARAKAQAERLAAQQAEQERLAAEKTKVEQARLAAERVKAEQERLASEKAKADQERLAREKAETQRLAAETAKAKAQAERLAAEAAASAKAENERLAAEKAKAERERLAAVRAAESVRPVPAPVSSGQSPAEAILAADAAGAEAAPPAVAVPVKQPAAIPKKNTTARKETKKNAALRQKAIAGYKAVIDRYPGSTAAANASARLRNLGITYPPVKAGKIPAWAKAPSDENARVLTLEVDQYAGLDFSLAAEAYTAEAGKRLTVPFELVNQGNAPDRFLLESGFPAEYQLRFAAAGSPDVPLTRTPGLAPGERFKGVAQLVTPAGVMDGERKLYPLKAVSESDINVSQSRPVRLVAAAPLLRVVVKTDSTGVRPGERVQYRLALLNVGSAPARQVALRLTFPPQYEPADPAAAGLKADGNGLLLEGLQLGSGENRELNVTMRLKEDALAQQELYLRAELLNRSLQRQDSFLSTPAMVKAVSGVAAVAHAERLTAIPGQTVAIPLTITNTGNLREDFILKPAVSGNLTYAFYLDQNRDGVRQANEPIINHVGPLAPKEVANVVLEIATPASEQDGVGVPLAIGFAAESDRSATATVNLKLLYSRPVLELVMSGRGGKLKPGEVSSFELNCTNNGSSLARVVEVESLLPAQLELVAADPGFSQGRNGAYVWKFEELGSGEKRSIRVTYRVRSGTASGTSLALKNILKYQDQLGNSY
jgi:hypothetical protein